MHASNSVQLYCTVGWLCCLMIAEITWCHWNMPVKQTMAFKLMARKLVRPWKKVYGVCVCISLKFPVGFSIACVPIFVLCTVYVYNYTSLKFLVGFVMVYVPIFSMKPLLIFFHNNTDMETHDRYWIVISVKHDRNFWVTVGFLWSELHRATKKPSKQIRKTWILHRFPEIN